VKGWTFPFARHRTVVLSLFYRVIFSDRGLEVYEELKWLSGSTMTKQYFFYLWHMVKNIKVETGYIFITNISVVNESHTDSIQSRTKTWIYSYPSFSLGILLHQIWLIQLWHLCFPFQSAQKQKRKYKSLGISRSASASPSSLLVVCSLPLAQNQQTCPLTAHNALLVYQAHRIPPSGS
jgi:hypothetical protein